jgi:hypothetical protein
LQLTTQNGVNVLVASTDFIPVDPAKTYLFECWLNIPVPLTNGASFRPLLAEYDSNKVALPAHITGGASFMYQQVLSSTTGNTWQYFATEITGSAATPANNFQFNSSAKYVLAGVMMVASATTGQVGKIMGIRFSEVAAGYRRAISTIDANNIVVSAGIDFVRSYTNKNQDHIPDGTSFGTLPLANIAGSGTSKRALIDFTQSHVNKTLDNVADGATYGSIPLANIAGSGTSKRALIDFTQSHTNKVISNVPGTISDNLIKNGDFDQGLAGWTISPGSGLVVTATDYPRGSHSFLCNTVQTMIQYDLIPVDINKTYFIEAWIKSPAPGSLIYAGFVEADGNGIQITRSGAFAYALCAGITSTTGNNWQYFSAEISGNSASPTSTQFLNTAKFVRPMCLLNWTGATSPQQVQVLGFRFSEVAAGHTRALKLLQQGVSSDLNKQGSIVPGQAFALTWSANTSSISLSWSGSSLLRADGTSLTVSTSGSPTTFGSLSASTTYWFYPYINASTGVVGFANGSPPPTAPSSSTAIQAALDGRIPLVPFSVSTTSSGSTGGSGGDGSCPEADELVEIQDKGLVRAADVQFGDYIRGYSFEKQEDVFRRVIGTGMKSCAAWRIVSGHKVSPCEPVYLNNQWLSASRVPGAPLDTTIGLKIDIVVEADDFDQHNYYLMSGTQLLIHNPVLPRS